MKKLVRTALAALALASAGAAQAQLMYGNTFPFWNVTGPLRVDGTATFNGSVVKTGVESLTVNSSSDALTVTQTGAGAVARFNNASGDTTPVIVDTDTNLLVGKVTAVATAFSTNASTPLFQVHKANSINNGVGLYQYSANTSSAFHGANFSFNRSGSNTLGTLAAVTTSMPSLGNIIWNGVSSDSTWASAARIVAVPVGTIGAGSVPADLVMLTTTDLDTTPSSKLRIGANGDLSILATAKIRLDGVAGTGDTHIAESAANIITLTAGGTASLAVGAATVTSPGPIYSTAAPVTETGATHTVAATTNNLIANRAGTVTVTLPAAASFTGRTLTIKTIQAQTVVSASANVAPVDSATAGTAILAATAGKWATLVSDGTSWVIMAAN